MALPLLTQYLRQVDDHGPRSGVVAPCDVFKHLTAKGMERRKAAVLAAVLTVAGGLTTNPDFPLYAKPPPRTRSFEATPPDPLDIVQRAGGDLLAKVLAIADALMIPPLLDDEPTPRKHWFEHLLHGGRATAAKDGGRPRNRDHVAPGRADHRPTRKSKKTRITEPAPTLSRREGKAPTSLGTLAALLGPLTGLGGGRSSGSGGGLASSLLGLLGSLADSWRS